MATKVLLHIGTPKTGTTHVQDFLFSHKSELAQQGILYPGTRFDQHFLAALDLMSLPWGGLEREAVGAWDALATAIRAWPGTVIVSHEILARASRPQIDRALTSFGDAEVHIVVSARDLVRQIPAEYQENVKHRRVLTYEAFLDQVVDPTRTGNIASWFWAVQDVPDLLDRWAASIPPEHVHVITVPHRGGAPEVLMRRFAEVFGVDPQALAGHESRTNPSLGAAETALLRRVNEAVVPTGLVPPRHYRDLVRELIAHNTLSQRSSTPRLRVPPRIREWAATLGDHWIEELKTRGYDVVGDLEELRAAPDTAMDVPGSDPDHPDEVLVSDAAVSALTAVIRELKDSREREQELRAELRHVDEDVTAVELFKRWVVRHEETSRLIRWPMRVYRRLRRR